MRILVSCLSTLFCLVVPAAFASTPQPANDEQKTLYALGLVMSQSISTLPKP